MDSLTKPVTKKGADNAATKKRKESEKENEKTEEQKKKEMEETEKQLRKGKKNAAKQKKKDGKENENAEKQKKKEEKEKENAEKQKKKEEKEKENAEKQKKKAEKEKEKAEKQKKKEEKEKEKEKKRKEREILSQRDDLHLQKLFSFNIATSTQNEEEPIVENLCIAADEDSVTELMIEQSATSKESNKGSFDRDIVSEAVQMLQSPPRPRPTTGGKQPRKHLTQAPSKQPRRNILMPPALQCHRCADLEKQVNTLKRQLEQAGSQSKHWLQTFC